MEVLMKENIVRDWMTADPLTIAPSTTIHHAHQIMMNADVRHLPVVAGGRLVSLITLNDIRRAEMEIAAACRSSELKELVNQLKSVAEIMEDDPITITPDASIAKAARLLLEGKLTALPVLVDEMLVGIITEADIFRYVAEMRQEGELLPV
jgi:acetoin utilization protein AcuB